MIPLILLVQETNLSMMKKKSRKTPQSILNKLTKMELHINEVNFAQTKQTKIHEFFEQDFVYILYCYLCIISKAVSYVSLFPVFLNFENVKN